MLKPGRVLRAVALIALCVGLLTGCETRASASRIHFGAEGLRWVHCDDAHVTELSFEWRAPQGDYPVWVASGDMTLVSGEPLVVGQELAGFEVSEFRPLTADAAPGTLLVLVSGPGVTLMDDFEVTRDVVASDLWWDSFGNGALSPCVPFTWGE